MSAPNRGNYGLNYRFNSIQPSMFCKHCASNEGNICRKKSARVPRTERRQCQQHCFFGRPPRLLPSAPSKVCHEICTLSWKTCTCHEINFLKPNSSATTKSNGKLQQIICTCEQIYTTIKVQNGANSMEITDWGFEMLLLVSWLLRPKWLRNLHILIHSGLSWMVTKLLGTC